MMLKGGGWGCSGRMWRSRIRFSGEGGFGAGYR